MNIKNLEEIYKYNKRTKFKFHMPGNFGGENLPYGFVKNMPFFETTEIHGMDDYHAPDGIIKKAERELSTVFGSKNSIFLVNGSTSGVLAAMSYFFNEKDKVLITRDCHKSVQYGLVISGAKPIYFLNSRNREYGILLPPTYSEILHELNKDNHIKGVILTSPNYYGVGIKELEKISDLCVSRGIKIILDEAHGSHLNFTRFKKYLGNNGNIDIVVNSFHKNLNALTQTAMVHLNSEEISVNDFRRHISLVTTSSPSYLLLSSMQYSLSRYKNKGKEILNKTEKKAKYMKDLLDKYKIMYIEGKNLRGYYLDPTKVTIMFEKSAIAQRVYKNLILFGVYPELILDNKIVFFINSEIKIEYIRKTARLINIAIKRALICRLDEQDEKFATSILPKSSAISPRQGFYSIKEKIPIEQSVGRVATDIITPYPPGIPLIMPGEEITKEIVDYVKNTSSSVHGVKNGIIEVVRE
ncbi:aminotransferase class I/II-fold pyridoxal phosphate-dependent enzyme [Alkalicella caledoniensis]|uniref:Aminotransferase class I/II-fold pyridoxal phosphate-dependent enzyme n=1 Tax=Alkalicella caledoniensis TaxID=2731377 RepID=A0A7G9W894_ALKCA|nr:aminotransferase class I/II-fold pyridoxal phosphate-dependent enzyme [Alkalicella caledoniensis]QNO14906.1 aminotransferase class I/II-fold pyridoxal phosphate-dependent enzyme [Alkalicella caledoniensis]